MISESVLTENYESFARQIARIEWAMCDNEIDGRRIVNHLGDNNHDAPCDMLVRLGVMYVSIPDHGLNHYFPAGWSPLADFPLSRHSGEPTANDLWLGLTFWIHWFPNDANIDHRGQNGSIDTNFSVLGGLTPAWLRYRAWAIQGACELLCLLGLGAWNGDGKFEILDPTSTIDSLEAYWSSRSEMVKTLGGEELLYPAAPGST